MGTTEIGALIVALRSESAQFRAEMEGARRSMGRAGDQATVSSRQIAKLAADGFGAVLPISFQVENAIEKFIEKTLKAQGALALLGKATLALGAGLLSFKLGERLGELAALGTTAEKYAEAIKKATDEQKKFSDQLARERGALRDLDIELAKIRGDEAGALRLSQTRREAGIIAAFGGASATTSAALARSRQLAVAENAKLLDDQRRAREENEQKLLDQMQRERDAQVKTWQEETQALVEQLKARVKLRQDFEAGLGSGGIGSQRAKEERDAPGLAGGFGAVRSFVSQIRKEARDLAFLQSEGLISATDATRERGGIRDAALREAGRLRESFAHLPPVLEAIDRAVQSVEFGNFGREIQEAREHLAAFVPTSRELETALGGIAAKLIETLPATDAAAQATRTLTTEYLALANALYQVNLQASALAAQGG